MDMRVQLEALASRIQDNACLLGDWYAQSSTPTPPSSDGEFGRPSQGLLSRAPEEIRRAQKSLLETAWELQWLCAGPSDFLAQHRIHNQQLSCLRWLIHFKILSHIPLIEAGASWETVASSAKVPLSQLKSVALMAATSKFLRVVQPDRIAHSPISAQFVQHPQYTDWAEWATSYSAPTAHAFADATQRWGGSNAKDETAFNIAFDTKLPFFDYVAASGDMSAVFARYMRSRNQSEELALKHVPQGFNFGQLGEASVVDIGGSTGQASILLLDHYPGLHCTVQDLPGTIASASKVFANLGQAVASRLNFVVHDFFKPQPQNKAASTDVFFLRRILHDWPDAEAITILQHLATALIKPDARILIMDTILPSPGTEPPLCEATLRATDLSMRQMFNSREREIEDWVRLFESTMPKLELRNYKLPVGSALAVMEVVRASKSD